MPNDTNWQDITRRLDVVPASESPTCQPKERGRGRAIAKVPAVFDIPQQTIIAPGTSFYARLIYQMNCTASRAFRIIHINDTRDNVASATPSFVMCIRFRVGNIVTRYRLLPVNLGEIVDEFVEPEATLAVQAAYYTNQLIQPNFCIEWWCSTLFGLVVRTSTYNVKTNILQIPASSDEVSTNALTVQTGVTRDELVVAFPEALPTTYGQVSNWLTN